MTTLTDWQAFDLIHAEYEKMLQKPDERTIEEWQEHYKIETYAMAYGELERLRKADKMEGRIGISNAGKKCKLYRIKE